MDENIALVTRDVTITNNTKVILYVTVETEMEYNLNKTRSSDYAVKTYNFGKHGSYDKYGHSKTTNDANSNSYDNNSVTDRTAANSNSNLLTTASSNSAHGASSQSSSDSSSTGVSAKCMGFGASVNHDSSSSNSSSNRWGNSNSSFKNIQSSASNFLQNYSKSHLKTKNSESKYDDESVTTTKAKGDATAEMKQLANKEYVNTQSQWQTVELASGFIRIIPGGSQILR